MTSSVLVADLKESIFGRNIYLPHGFNSSYEWGDGSREEGGGGRIRPTTVKEGEKRPGADRV